jgi:hypothetical protein
VIARNAEVVVVAYAIDEQEGGATWLRISRKCGRKPLKDMSLKDEVVERLPSIDRCAAIIEFLDHEEVASI